MTAFDQPHRRKNPLTGRWVLVSPHRNNRPWLGATEAAASGQLPAFDADCPLCPGNTRANGETNPVYATTHVFANDFGALMPSAADPAVVADPLFQHQVTDGECRVVCFSPEHHLTLPEMSIPALVAVVQTWQQHYRELRERFACVHIFENKGAIMGCSQPHPHGQIWAHQHLSTEIELEDQHQAAYLQAHGRALLADYVVKEQQQTDRIVCQNRHWLVVVPYWAAWPFETLLLCKDDIQHIDALDAAQVESLAEILKELTSRYDNVFQCSFPYSMGWHNAPADGQPHSHWRLHAHFYPPLLRSATVKKHMVGYEMMAESQRDLTPETAAAILRQVSAVRSF
ncbi:UDP-glucose--hexose-1-phosphate uridylyltransferase [Rheinheimera sp.]|uniref:UDP-glucose--hexose-1-phosphate uridylyltransferase n=1 Tax=Rheinheimera sp. TaxID=1869214 RepID=UPI003D2A6BC7